MENFFLERIFLPHRFELFMIAIALSDLQQHLKLRAEESPHLMTRDQLIQEVKIVVRAEVTQFKLFLRSFNLFDDVDYSAVCLCGCGWCVRVCLCVERCSCSSFSCCHFQDFGVHLGGKLTSNSRFSCFEGNYRQCIFISTRACVWEEGYASMFRNSFTET